MSCRPTRDNHILDYWIASSSLFPYASALKVLPPRHADTDLALSDHCPVHLTLALTPPAPPTPPAPRPPPRYAFDHDRLPIYRDTLETALTSADLLCRAQDADDPPALTDTITALHDILLETASSTFALPPRQKRSKYPWFDAECRHARNKHHRLLALTPDPVERQRIRRKYQDLLRRKMNEHTRLETQRLTALLYSDPRRFCSALRPQHRAPCQAPPDLLHAHFAQLYDQPPPPATYDFAHTPPNTRLPQKQANRLQNPITAPEISAAARVLKNNKAPDRHGITAELLKALCPPPPPPESESANPTTPTPPLESLLLRTVTVLFNKMFHHGFPALLSDAHLVPLLKKGDPTDANNYRGIAIIPLLAKLYATVLNRRLTDALENAGVRASTQAGFRPDRSCADQIWTLQNLIDLHRSQLPIPPANTKPTKKPPKPKYGQPLYVCFVDFSKAFDTVPRALLWKRLLSLGVPEPFVDAIESYYASVRLCVRTDNAYSEPFASTMGVKQGCPLSPTLFGVFIDHFTEYLDYHELPPAPLIPDKRRSLPQVLYFADDIALVNHCPRRLQYLLDRLDAFCADTHMSVNLDKTQIVIFRPSQTLPEGTRTRFSYRGQQIAIVDEYRYLGFMFHAWKSPVDHGIPALVATATRAANFLRCRCHALGIRDLKAVLRLFDMYVRPILFYACEMWLPYLSSKNSSNFLKSPIEQVHVSFLRSFLNLPPSTPIAPLLWELGRSTLYPFALQQFGRFLHRIAKLDVNDYRHRILNFVLIYPQKTHYSKPVWSSLLQNVLHSPLSIENFQQKKFVQDLFDHVYPTSVTSLSSLFTQASPEKTLYRFYSSIASPQLRMAEYLTDLELPVSFRNKILRIRLGLAPLDNQRQRFLRIPEAHRTGCPLCDSPDVENEYHFLVGCELYSTLRTSEEFSLLFPRPEPPPGIQLSCLLNSSEYRLLGLFLTRAYELRKSRLNPI